MGWRVTGIIGDYADVGNPSNASYNAGMKHQQALSRHIILGGFGQLGVQIAELLRAQEFAVVVIDLRDDATLRAEAETLGCRYLVGNICEAQTLIEADIATARCVIIATGDERVNLQGSIKARQMNPQVPVVGRLFDEALVRHVEKIFNIYPLNSSTLASSAILSAATGITLLAEIEVDDKVLMLFQDETHHGGACGIRLNGDALSLAESPEEVSMQASIFAAHDHSARRAVHHHHLQIPQLPWRGWHPWHLWGKITDWWSRSSTITRRLIFAFVCITLISTVVFSVGCKLTPLDSLYFVVTTISTVGYGDINLQQAPPQLKIYGILLILAGATLLATLYSLLADAVLSARMEYLLGRRQVRLQHHIVVAGLGNVGARVALDLHQLGVDVVAIERDEDAEYLSAVRAILPVIIGDAHRRSILQLAGVERARVLITATSDPMLNLNITLHAREAHPQIRAVVLTHDPALAETFTGLGFNYVLSSAAIAAPSFIAAALYPGVKASFRLKEQDVLIARLMLPEDSPLAGRTVRDIGATFGIVPLLDADHHFFTPDSVLSAGEQIIVLLSRTKTDLLSSNTPEGEALQVLADAGNG